MNQLIQQFDLLRLTIINSFWMATDHKREKIKKKYTTYEKCQECQSYWSSQHQDTKKTKRVDQNSSSTQALHYWAYYPPYNCLRMIYKLWTCFDNSFICAHKLLKVHVKVLPRWHRCHCWQTMSSESTPACAARGPWEVDARGWSLWGLWYACDRASGASTFSG